jgi:hypothetical protein
MMSGLRTSLACFALAIFAMSCASDKALPGKETSARQSAYAVVTNAINREDWNGLRRLATAGRKAKASEYIGYWEKNPIRVGKLVSVDENFELNGVPCTKYSFALEYKDGRPHPHWLQVMVHEQDGRSVLEDFWEFGW